MQKIIGGFLSAVLLLIATNSVADEQNPPNSAGASQQSDELAKLTKYLQNFGEYFGYDVTQYCTSGGSCKNNNKSSDANNTDYTNTLFSANDTYTLQLNLYNSYLGSLLGGGTTNSINYMPIVPESMASFAFVNNLAGNAFINPPFNTPSESISVSPIIDQKSYQNDPVSQALLNILATPNYTYCYDTSSTKLNTNCTYLTKQRIMANIMGEIPATLTAFTFDYNQPLINQLNSEALISPLLYSTTSTEPNNADANSVKNGLTAQSQAQQAINFIRYVTGSVIPINLPQKKVYDDLYMQTINKNQSPTSQATAAAALTNFLMSLRVYAAQTSVSLNNLYYILSRRMPQKLTSTSKSGSSSEALNEFTMASWRLFNPANNDGSLNSQWLTKINSASNATVQKEMAILLAEINYQLYLSRQQQERLLLTQSIANIQNTFTGKPDGSTLASTNVTTGP